MLEFKAIQVITVSLGQYRSRFLTPTLMAFVFIVPGWQNVLVSNLPEQTIHIYIFRNASKN